MDVSYSSELTSKWPLLFQNRAKSKRFGFVSLFNHLLPIAIYWRRLFELILQSYSDGKFVSEISERAFLMKYFCLWLLFY
jgi:hypothetical protein